MGKIQMQQKTEFPPLPDTGFVRLPHLLYLCGGISKTTLYEGIKNGDFPAPKKLTSRTSVWSVDDVRALVERVNQTTM